MILWKSLFFLEDDCKSEKKKAQGCMYRSLTCNETEKQAYKLFSSKGNLRRIAVRMRDCDIVGSKFESHPSYQIYFFDKYLWEIYKFLYFFSNRLTNTPFVLLRGRI